MIEAAHRSILPAGLRAGALLVLAIILALHAPAWAALPKPEQVVQITGARLAQAAGNRPVLRVDAAILPGWHINSDKPSSSDYIATRLSIKPPATVRVEDIAYPPAQLIAPEFSMGEKLSVFTGAVTFRANLAEEAGVKPGQPMAFELSLDYQACNERQCLRPATITRAVTLQWPGAVPSRASALKTYSAATPPAAPARDLFASHGLVLGFLMVFLGGLALNLTPCVYPLIGVTLAYF